MFAANARKRARTGLTILRPQPSPSPPGKALSRRLVAHPGPACCVTCMNSLASKFPERFALTGGKGRLPLWLNVRCINVDETPVSEGFEPSRRLRRARRGVATYAARRAPAQFERRRPVFTLLPPSFWAPGSGLCGRSYHRSRHDAVSEREKFNSSNIHCDGSSRPRACTNLRAAPRRWVARG